MSVLSRSLQRRQSFVLAALLAIAAAFAARGVSALLGMKMAPGVSALLERSNDAPRGPVADVRERSADAILRHDMFCSTCVPPSAAPPAPSDVAPPNAPCASVRVHAIVAAPDAEWSFAAIQPQGGGSLLRRKG